MVSHLLFTGDSLLIARATGKDVGCLKVVVDAYYSIFGQAINLSKSYISISPKTPNAIKEQIKYLLMMREANSVWSYLGLPLSAT